MANSPQATKRARQSIKRNVHNTSVRSTMRTALKKVIKLVSETNKEATQVALKAAIVLVDRAAGNGLIHANKAARLKSRLNKKVRNHAVNS